MARAVVFVGLAIFMTVGPFYKQVLNHREPWIRAWEMFSGKGVGAVTGHFEQVAQDGSAQPLDHYALLGVPHPWDPEPPPRRVWLVHGKEEFQNLVKKICRELPPRAHVRAQARIATQKGWRTLENGQRNVCAGIARKQRRRPRRTRRGR